MSKTARIFERPSTEEEKKQFLSFVQFDTTSGCWNWTGTLGSGRDDEYGKFSWNGWSTQAHRFSWYLFRGEPGAENKVHHLCVNKKCVNPSHLYPLSHEVHMAIHRIDIINCINNHPFNPDNTNINKQSGRRHCLECAKELDKRRYASRYKKEKELKTNSSEMKDFPRNPKLSFEIAEQIRQEYTDTDTSQRKLARKYKVSQPMIGMILRNETWKKEIKDPKETLIKALLRLE